MVQQDLDDLLRFDLVATGSSMFAFAGRLTAGTATDRLRQTIPTPTGPTWVRVTRTGTNWTLRISTNGTDWTTIGTFTDPLTPTSIGPHAANHGYPAPAYTGIIDQFTVLAGGGTTPPPSNTPPSVDAGPDAAATTGVATSLAGTVSDDGLPDPPATLTVAWTQASGPGPASFTDDTSPTSTVTFDTPGDYVLQLSADDGSGPVTDTVTYTVTDPVTTPSNTPPSVDAGPDAAATTGVATSLAGTVSDDGLPDPPATLTVAWTQASGPGPASFTDDTSPTSTVTFDTPGDYVLQLSADDSTGPVTDTVTYTVTDPVTTPSNTPPSVDAGPDAAATTGVATSLAGTVSDDGLPDPPATLTVAWTQASGPGPASFTDATSPTSTVTFDTPGDYVLQLSADDGSGPVTDTVTYTVTDPGSGGSSGSGPSSDSFDGTSLDPVWTLIDPRGDVTLTVSGGAARLALPAGATHDLWTGRNYAPRLQQPIGDTDFDVTAKFTSIADTRYQFHGIVVQQDLDDLLRFDLVATGSSMFAFAGRLTAGTATDRLRQTIPTPTGPTWVRVTRTGTNWTLRISTNGTDWTTIGTFTDPLTPTSIGPHAANHGYPAPAYTGIIDQFTVLAGGGTTPPPSNTPPSVDAGPDAAATTGVATSLAGTVSDDGLPDPPATLTVAWTQASGPGPASFTDDTSPTSTVTFDTPGDYVLQLSADDSTGPVTDTVTYTVTDPVTTPSNTPPSVDAGPDAAATTGVATSLAGTVSDDGLPDPPSTLTVAWTQASGPGPASFTDDTSPTSTVTFDTPGDYVLQLSADDGSGPVTDTVTYTVTDPGSGGSSGSGPSSDSFDGTSLDPVWTLIDPRGDVTLTVSGGAARLALPAGATHDLWTGRNYAPGCSSRSATPTSTSPPSSPRSPTPATSSTASWSSRTSTTCCASTWSPPAAACSPSLAG